MTKNKEEKMSTEKKEEVKQETIKNPYDCTYMIQTNGSKGLKTAYFRYPDRLLYYQILRKASSSDTGEYEAGEMILAGCFINGDTEIINEDEYIISSALAAAKIVEINFGELKKN